MESSASQRRWPALGRRTAALVLGRPDDPTGAINLRRTRHFIRDTTTDPRLTGAARAVNAIDTQIYDADNERTVDSSPYVAWVSPESTPAYRAV